MKSIWFLEGLAYLPYLSDFPIIQGNECKIDPQLQECATARNQYGSMHRDLPFVLGGSPRVWLWGCVSSLFESFKFSMICGSFYNIDFWFNCTDYFFTRAILDSGGMLLHSCQRLRSRPLGRKSRCSHVFWCMTQTERHPSTKSISFTRSAWALGSLSLHHAFAFSKHWSQGTQ